MLSCTFIETSEGLYILRKHVSLTCPSVLPLRFCFTLLSQSCSLYFGSSQLDRGCFPRCPPIHRSVEVELCEEALRTAKASHTTCHTLHFFTPALWSHTQPDLLRASRRGCVQEQAFQKPKASRTATHPSTLLAT